MAKARRAAAFVLMGFAIGCSSAPEETTTDGGPHLAPVPPRGDPLHGVTLFDGWTDPRALSAEINTTGWEDSSYISADGKTLYFGYSRADFYKLATPPGQLVYDGPERSGETRPVFEIFEATIDGSAWTVRPSTANSTDPNVAEAAEGVNDAETLMAFVRFENVANSGDIYLTTKQDGIWQPADKLVAPISTACVDDNAGLSRDGKRLYFDSNRADPEATTCTTDGSRTIYTSSFENGAWSAPQPIAGAPNEPNAFHWQVYPRSDPDLYWAGADKTCLASGAGACIFRAHRGDDGSYGDPVIVASVPPQSAAQVGDVYGIGEVSITDDGRWMYFTYVEKTQAADGSVSADVNIGAAHRP